MNWEIMWIMFFKWVIWFIGFLFLVVIDCNNWNNSFFLGNFDNVFYELCLSIKWGNFFKRSDFC